MNPMAGVRPSPIAGTWYSGNPRILAEQIDEFIEDAAVPSMTGKVVGLIAPHAGHRYSGRTAGHAFKTVRGAVFDLVVIISPFHGYHPAAVITSAHSHYATPLGEIPVDQKAVQAVIDVLAAESQYNVASISEDDEHSLEIELPFLQRSLAGEFSLLPVMLRTRDERLVKALGNVLARQISGKSALMIASSDLSHFYPLKIAERLDGEMLRQVEAFSPEGVLAAELSGTGFACGAAAIATLLFAARKGGAEFVKVLHYSTSADETGDSSSVVGYGAAAVLKNG